MFCLQCGTQNSLDSKFCKQCGEQISASRDDIRRYRSAEANSIAAEVDPVERANPQIQRLLEMAFWHNQTGNAPGAILACEAALIIDPESTTALSLLGCSYERQGDIQKAVYAFERVLEINPDSEADQDKLSALKRGEFLKPVVQPIQYRWLPPAMVGAVKSGQAARIAVAAASGLAIFLIGMAIVRPHDVSSTAQAADPGLSGISASARYASGQDGSSDQSPPGTAPRPASQSASPPVQTAGSYATIPAINQPLYGAAAAAPPSYSRVAAPGTQQELDSRGYFVTRQRDASRLVPPLSVAATADPGAPPMSSVKPLLVPDDQLQRAVQVQVAGSLPQHTVVVGGSGTGQSDTSSQISASGASETADPGPPAPASRISIHVHSSAEDPVAPSSNLLPSNPSDGFTSARARVSSGSLLQQKALQLQQQGDYRAAAKQYSNAIAAFKHDAATEQDSDSARRGIAACETGLEICQQSQ